MLNESGFEFTKCDNKSPLYGSIKIQLNELKIKTNKCVWVVCVVQLNRANRVFAAPYRTISECTRLEIHAAVDSVY